MKIERSRRERLLTFLLLPALILAVLVLSGTSLRSSFQLDKLREQAVVETLLDLANTRASLLDQMIVEQDTIVQSEANTEALEMLAESWLEIADRQTPTVRAVLVLDLSSPKNEVLVYASRAPGLGDDQFRRLLLYRMFDDLRLEEPRNELRHLHRSYDGQNYLLSYWQQEQRTRRYLVVAWHDVARIVHEYLPSLYGGRRSAGESETKNVVNVVDSAGRIIFGPPLSSGEFTVGRQFQTTLYKWRLNVAPTGAEQLARRAERRLQFEIVLGVLSALVVIAGSIVILNAAARQRRLAALKSEFVANVSHELKTPLSLIRMFAELLQTGRVSDAKKYSKYVGIIVTESERLTGLIDNVLDFAKVERGGATYEFTAANLGEVVFRAVEVCRPRAEREGVKLELSLAEELYSERLDERAIEIAVINLIDNAVKYARSGGWIGISVSHGSGKHIQVVVSDLGEGISEGERTTIFDRFVRGKRDKGTRGSGIGLSLVRSIAHAHGGRVWVESNQPRGARFCLSLRAG